MEKRSPENRLKRGHQQREANREGSEKEEEVSRVLSGFSLTLRPRKIQNFFFPNEAVRRLSGSLKTSVSRKASFLSFSVSPW